jgi:hypothetical protein
VIGPITIYKTHLVCKGGGQELWGLFKNRCKILASQNFEGKGADALSLYFWDIKSAPNYTEKVKLTGIATIPLV